MFCVWFLQTLKLALKTLWLLVLFFLSHICKYLRPFLIPVLIYSTGTKTNPQKLCFWSSSYKVILTFYNFEIIIFFLKLGHKTILAIQLSHVMKFDNDVIDLYHDIISLILQIIFKKSPIVKKIKNFVWKSNFYLHLSV